MNAGILILMTLPALLGSAFTAVNAKKINAAWQAKRGVHLAARGLTTD